MPFKDLREFISRAEKAKEIQRIEEEVDWDLEAAAMLRRSYEQHLPAPFFQKLKGYRAGYRMLGGVVASYKRAAIAMDLDPNISQKQITEEYLKRSKRLIKPVMVSNGPCKENIHTDHQVDLFEFPVPRITPKDGGRYIGTFSLVISKDPDSDWVNWGMYRQAVHNKNTLGILAEPYTHLGMIYGKQYEPRNKTMEVAIAIGVEPISAWCGAIPVPYGVSEVDVAGGIRGEPVELVKCETVDLPVPASAEIVIEGEIKPGERMDEGPFGEYTGYVAGVREPRKVIHVKAITHRNDPILTISAPGLPLYEGHLTSSIARSAEILRDLTARGIPVSGVSLPPEGVGLLAVVAVKSLYSNIAEQVAHAVWGSEAGKLTPYLIVVNDDVDPFNMGEVIHALVSKCHPVRGITKQEHTTANPLWSFLDAHERRYKLGARALFDCTWPLDWAPSDVPARVSFREIYPPEIQKQALAKWQKYGY